MSELLALQHDLADALRHADAAPRAARWLAGDTALVQRRLGIYRANVAASIESALAGAYPIVKQVVGDEFFGGLAREFLKSTPSTSGDLTDYGGGFDAFLRAFPHTASMPYLPDLARLEWAVHRAHGARDASAWDASALAHVAPEQQAAIRFAWTPGGAIIDSPYPLVRVWAFHQPTFDGEFSVDGSIAECAWVAREGFRVTVTALAAGDAAFIGAGLNGAALGACAEAALAADPSFDLAALLARAVTHGWVCGFQLDESIRP